MSLVRTAFTNVFEKLPTIYHNIKRNLGGNDLVEDESWQEGRCCSSGSSSLTDDDDRTSVSCCK